MLVFFLCLCLLFVVGAVVFKTLLPLCLCYLIFGHGTIRYGSFMVWLLDFDYNYRSEPDVFFFPFRFYVQVSHKMLRPMMVFGN